MRDLGKTIDYIERGLLLGLERKAVPPPKEKPRPSIRAWRAPATAAEVRYPVEQIFRPNTGRLKDPGSPGEKRDQLTVTARALKITVPLDVAEVAALPAPDGQARSQLTITCEGKSYIADISTKALRKARGTILANDVENVFVMIQGKLKGTEIIECGLVAQVKTPKPVTAASA
jgi:hypothetical protein